ncbi:hypothetical protein GCM10020000_68570 [Streptomyces olivoverticillatus]
MHEDVQRGEDPGEFVAGEGTEEAGARQGRAQSGRLRPVPGDDDADARQRADGRQ